jgi:hypothetical protein
MAALHSKKEQELGWVPVPAVTLKVRCFSMEQVLTGIVVNDDPFAIILVGS